MHLIARWQTQGTVVVNKLSEDRKTNEVYPPLSVGKYFGELALRNSNPRAATVTAKTDVTCLRLTQQVCARAHATILSCLSIRRFACPSI
jgi:CRP-like cAMP-binding protein